MAYKRSYSNTKDSSSSGSDVVIELDKKKQVTVRRFNKVNLVDIREFYIDKDTDEKKPGKKGISLTEDSWKKLLDSAAKVQEALDKLNGVERKASDKKEEVQPKNKKPKVETKKTEQGEQDEEESQADQEEESDEDAD